LIRPTNPVHSSCDIKEKALQTISITEARRRFSAIIQEVMRGESFIITLYGKPMARIERVRRKRAQRRLV